MLSPIENELKFEDKKLPENLFVPNYDECSFMNYKQSNMSKIHTAVIIEDVILFEEIVSALDVKEMCKLFDQLRTRTREGYPCEKFIDILFKKINSGEINLELEFSGIKMKEIIITSSVSLSNLKYIKQLIDLGFDITTPNKPNEALIVACICGNLEMVKFLLEYGFDPNHNNTESFREACLCNQLEICEYLLKYGVKTDFNSREFLHLIIEVIKRNNYDILQLLIDNGANLSFINSFVEEKSKNCRYNGLFDLLVSQGVKERNAHLLIHNISIPKNFARKIE
uniref:Ankyrin repeat-containing protein n=1 Tax=Borely moumouvirus TaxID=2712067 RepID=A0A6G6ACY0_9VIRU